jgi:hypothetical protein
VFITGACARQMLHDMALQAPHAVAGEPGVAPVIGQFALLVVAHGAVEQARVAVQPHHAGGAFHQHFPHGEAAVVGRMIDQPVAVEQRPGAGLELEDDVSRILPGDDRVELGEPRRHRRDLAEEEAEDVDEMDRRLVDEKALHLLEIGLAVEIGPRPLAVAGAQPEADLVELAQQPGVDAALDLAVPGLEAEVLVDDEAQVRVLGDAGGLLRLGQRAAERLLADGGGNAALGRQADQLEVGGGRGDDVEQIRFFGVQHLARIGVGRGMRQRSAKARAFSASWSQTATRSTSSIPAQASWWNWLKYPAPIVATRSLPMIAS